MKQGISQEGFSSYIVPDLSVGQTSILSGDDVLVLQKSTHVLIINGACLPHRTANAVTQFFSTLIYTDYGLHGVQIPLRPGCGTPSRGPSVMPSRAVVWVSELEQVGRFLSPTPLSLQRRRAPPAISTSMVPYMAKGSASLYKALQLMHA